MKKILLLLSLLLAGAPARAQQSPHGALKVECSSCHDTESWRLRPSADFSHESTGFPLAGKHASVGCASCHRELRFSGTRAACASCHTDVHKGELGTDCARCHTPLAWKVPDMVERHQRTRFTLFGRHTSLECAACHIRTSDHLYTGVPVTCVGCHGEDYRRTTAPNHQQAGFSTDCLQCHEVTSQTWSKGFDHATTGFPLTGSHLAASCSRCHIAGAFKGTPAACGSCHTHDFSRAQAPNHTRARFSIDCRGCHTTAAWKPASYDHNTTRFPLTGAHRQATCADCHANNVYAGHPSACNDCHGEDYQQSRNPSHLQGNFSRQCNQCHTTAGWRPATYDHGATRFPLTGAHTPLQCQSCHVNGNYQLQYTDCYPCHREDFAQPVNPNHVAGLFGHDCTPCHTTAAWRPSTFAHGATRFPLTGAHTPLQCQSCHVNGNYQLQYTDCYPCHQDDFARPVNPNHVAGLFGHDCTPCHTTTAWTPSTFNHATTRYPLAGAHRTVPCSQCHVNNVYRGLPMTCYGCHEADFRNATNPNHVAGNFSHDCTTCHSMNGWSPASFNHAATRFPLTGAHTPLACQACHVNGNYQLQYTDCYPCHQDDFARPVNPNHVAGNFAHACDPCHTTTAWTPSTFNHATTRYPLVGAHRAVVCSQCHVNNVYRGLPMTCYGCHEADFRNTTNPNHVAGNFSHDCTTCHSMNGWSPASFNHGVTRFPLTGAHVPLACQACHVNGNYQLQYTDCYPCHQDDYARPTTLNHVTLLLSHSCDRCHTTTAWLPSTFNHDTQFFRVYSGAHLGRWTSCAQCHPTPGAYTQFTCISCHEHSQTLMDAAHQGRPGYVYSSPACYSCHRND